LFTCFVDQVALPLVPGQPLVLLLSVFVGFKFGSRFGDDQMKN
jgi:hypothetical protein